MDSSLTCVLYVACLLVALHCSTAQGKLALPIAAGYEIIGRAGYRPNGIISMVEESKLGSEWCIGYIHAA